MPSSPIMRSPLAPDTVARIHWLGKKRLGVEASAYYFMRMWELPETVKLERQTLDKLATAPWRLLRGEQESTNVNALFLRPLLEDVTRDEAYFEFRQATNDAEELAFAIRLDQSRAGVWETNLAMIFHSLTGVWPIAVSGGGHGWTLKQPRNPRLVQLQRIGHWTVLSAGQGKSSLADEISERIQRYPNPFAFSKTNHWIEADINAGRLAAVLGWSGKLFTDLPEINVSVTGDGGNAITHSELFFEKPLPIQIEPWTVPTNLIHEPLANLTAVRGVKNLLGSSEFWKNLNLGDPPNEWYFWTSHGSPMQTFVAAPARDANVQVKRLTDILLQTGNQWLGAHGVGTFQQAADSNGLVWSGVPMVTPFIKAVGPQGGSTMFAGLMPDAGSGASLAPGNLLHDLRGRPNLLYYDWERTGPRIESLLYIGQILRLATRHAQLPQDSTGAVWLAALMPRMDTSTTFVTQAGPQRLLFDRKATLGLTAMELHLLVDWLESPQFPVGLHTTLTPPNATQASNGVP
jgi:hypothetical protein